MGVGSARVGRHPAPVEFQKPNFYANQEDWNGLVMAAKLPGGMSSNFADVFDFINEWCGRSNSGTVGMSGFSFK